MIFEGGCFKCLFCCADDDDGCKKPPQYDGVLSGVNMAIARTDIYGLACSSQKALLLGLRILA